MKHLKVFEDKKLPYWRVIAKIKNSNVVTEVENFEYGFRDGESLDRVSSFTNNYTFQKENYVTVITKNPEKIDLYKEKALEKLFKILNDNLKSQIDSVKKGIKSIEKIKKCIKSDAFKDIPLEDFNIKTFEIEKK